MASGDVPDYDPYGEDEEDEGGLFDLKHLQVRALYLKSFFDTVFHAPPVSRQSGCLASQ